MEVFQTVKPALEQRGFSVRCFANAQEAAIWLDGEIDNTSVGIGGSATVEASGVYERLSRHNRVVWHWKQEPAQARVEAMQTEAYLTSVNALAQTGEMVNIDGNGNRVASTLFGHRRVYFLVGRNKLTSTYDEAVWRARNVAAPARARQLAKKTPCAVEGGHCHDCRSPERICNGLVTLWGPMGSMEMTVLLIDEDLGL